TRKKWRLSIHLIHQKKHLSMRNSGHCWMKAALAHRRMRRSNSHHTDQITWSTNILPRVTPSLSFPKSGTTKAGKPSSTAKSCLFYEPITCCAHCSCPAETIRWSLSLSRDHITWVRPFH